METKIFTKTELSEAAAIIRNGGVVAMPTETVYGLAANALDTEAVRKIYEAKGRQSDNPLIVHIANISDWGKLVEEVPQNAKLLAERFWPGPLTIVLKKSALVPDIVSGGLDTVAVRMPKNKIAFRFIKECGVPLAAPSANLSGAPSPTKFSHVYADMNGRIDGIIDGGDCMVGLESTVISLAEETPIILRPGRISAEQLRKVIGKVAIHPSATQALNEGESALSPGMKYKHYAPKAELQLLEGNDLAFSRYIQKNADEKTAVICFDEQLDELEGLNTFSLGAKQDSVTHAKRLFDILRSIDERGLTKAFAPLCNSEGVGLAVNNRLLCAAGFRVIALDQPTPATVPAIAADSPDARGSAAAPQTPANLTQISEDNANSAAKSDNDNTETFLSADAPQTVEAPAAQLGDMVLDESRQAAESEDFTQLEVDAGRVVNNFSAFEEDSAILALNDVRFGEDFNEDFSKAISDNITVVEKTSEEDPTKIFYEALIDEDGIKPVAYPVETIDDDFQFDVYEDEEPKKKGFFARLFGRKDEEEEEEPEPFLPMPNYRWNSQNPIKYSDAPTGQNAPAPVQTKRYEKIPGIKVVGLTGKTGCGKTYIATRMAAKTPDSLVIDADEVYHSMLETDSMILSLVLAFGDSILIGKRINRKRLAALAFASEENLQKLNETVLPAVAEKIISLIETAKTNGIKTVFLDAPTLIESGLNQVCNEVIFIIADPAIRQERIVERDNITLDEIGQRMRFERDDEFYVRFADRIIRNN